MSPAPIPEAKARALMISNGLNPRVPYPGSNRPWSCVCMTCGSECSPRYNSVQQGQGGCGKCGRDSQKETKLLETHT